MLTQRDFTTRSGARARLMPLMALVVAFCLANTMAGRATATIPSNTPVLSTTSEDVRRAPTVEILPNGGTYSSAARSLTVYYCDNGNGSNSLDAPTITLNGTDVTHLFSFGTWSGGGCETSMRSDGTITLRADTADTVVASICDIVLSTCGADTAVYLYNPPPSTTPWAMLEVTPPFQSVVLERGAQHVQHFRVWNRGNQADSVIITLQCEGSAIASACPAPLRQFISAAGVLDISTVTLTVGSTAGASGTLRIRAQAKQDSTVRDSALIALTVVSVPSAGVLRIEVDSGTTKARDHCLLVGLARDITAECGALRVDHVLPSTRTFNRPRAPTLVYNSDFADAVVRIAANVTLPNSGLLPDRVTASWRFAGEEQAAGEWTGTDWSAVGTTRRIGLVAQVPGLATGAYSDTLTVTRHYPDSTRTWTAVGYTVVVNRSESAFGAGWWLAGLEQLFHYSGGRKLWIGGDGSARLFRPTVAAGETTWVTSKVDRLEVLKRTGGTYCRRLPQRGCVRFDTSGRHVSTEGPLPPLKSWAHRSRFGYDSQGRLATIRLPAPRDTSGAQLQYEWRYSPAGDTVFAPAAQGQPRISLLWRESSGAIDSIRAPGNDTSIRFLHAVSPKRITGRINRRGDTTHVQFGDGETVDSVRQYLRTDTVDSNPVRRVVTIGYFAQERLGLDGTAAAAPHLVSARIDGPREGDADTTRLWLTPLGRPWKLRDALGTETLISYSDSFPALVTALRHPNGFVEEAAYDALGRLDSLRALNPYGPSSGVALTWYQWENDFDQVKRITAPTGEIVEFGYDTHGNRIWQRSGEDTARNTRFAYDSLRLLVSLRLPASNSPDSLAYDLLGNLSGTVSPRGRAEYVHRDSIGRDTLTVSVLTNIAPQRHLFRRVTYDSAGRTRTVHSWSDSALTIDGPDTVIVLTTYDAEDNVIGVSTWSDPDPNGIGTVQRTFAYDGAQRLVKEALVGGPTIPFTYDAAGNLTNGGRQGGNSVVVTYDVLNRAVRRLATGGPTAGEADEFVYDAMGRLRAASNPAARIRQNYYPNGALRSDTLRLATAHLPDSNFTQHVFGQRYAYDLSGRRRVHWHPSQLSSGTDSVVATYDAITGELATLRDPFGHLTRFSYDLAGRLERRSWIPYVSATPRRDSVTTKHRYDAEGNLVRREVTRDSLTPTQVRLDTMVYDLRGKVVRAPSVGDSIAYTPLGAVRWSSFTEVGTEEIFSDALGNRVEHFRGGTTTRSFYEAGTGLLLRDGHSTSTTRDTTHYTYDAGGALTETARQHSWLLGGLWEMETRTTLSTFDAMRRLIRTTYHLDTAFQALEQPPGYQPYLHTETYRYDPLGRRVATRVVRGPGCIWKDATSGCRSTLTRTVWDGDRVLFEIRVPGDTGNASLETVAPSATLHGGVVGYLHGAGGVDSPVLLWKGDQLVLPHSSWRGVYVQGTCPSVDCTNVAFPAGASSTFGVPPVYPEGLPSWHGSIVEQGQDASGYQYRRNRYYDPETGRFTQTDPIGLAGGLNLYGYAGGDPVNNSDPFGLCCHLPGGAIQSLVNRALTEVALDASMRRAFLEIGSAPTITITATLQSGPVAAEFDGTSAPDVSLSAGASVAATLNLSIGSMSGSAGSGSLGGLAQGPGLTVLGGALHLNNGRIGGATFSFGIGWVPRIVEFTGAKGSAATWLNLVNNVSVGVTPTSSPRQ